MNCLINLIGRTIREGTPPGSRADQRRFLLRYAAQSAVKGQFAAAAGLFTLTIKDSNPSITETLTLAALRLTSSNHAEAINLFDRAISRLMADGTPTHDSPTAHRFQQEQSQTPPSPSLEGMIDDAGQNLREGRYVRATRLFQTIRNILELLLSAHAGKAIAESNITSHHSPDALKSLLSVANLDDLLLRMLARTHLAANVAVGLRQRALRDDLASWATNNQSVDTLLQAEFDSLKSISQANPAHSENNYRLGLVARALGRLDEAARAFQRVLNIHPHHTPSANRLAATLLQLNRPERIIQLLTSATHVPQETLALYNALASLTDEENTAGIHPANNSLFDRAIDSLHENLSQRQAPSVTRANIAFTLGEMGLLNEERSAWREAAAMAPSTLA